MIVTLRGLRGDPPPIVKRRATEARVTLPDWGLHLIVSEDAHGLTVAVADGDGWIHAHMEVDAPPGAPATVSLYHLSELVRVARLGEG